MKVCCLAVANKWNTVMQQNFSIMKNYVCLQTNSTSKKKGEMYTCYKDRNEKGG